MNLSNLSIPELRVLHQEVEQEIRVKEQDEQIQAREKILAIAQHAGISLQDLLGASTRIGSRFMKKKVTVRYRHPIDASLQWTGRGRQPKWIQEWEANGKSLDDLKI